MADLLKEEELPEVGPLPMELSPEAPEPPPADAAAPAPVEDATPALDEPDAPEQPLVEDGEGQG